MKTGRRNFVAALLGTPAMASIRLEAFGVEPPQARTAATVAQVLGARLNADSEFRLLARSWDAQVQLQIGGEPVGLTLRDGRVVDARDETVSQADVTLSAPTDAWSQGFGIRGLSVTGDQVGHLWPYYAAIFRLASIVRESRGAARSSEDPDDSDRAFDSVVGRYVYVRIGGVKHRVYFEESGRGIPLMLQHTAGADGREWRFMLEDAELQRHFRMIAYDLPYHGRSMPPNAVDWWAREYRLTKELALESVMVIAQALGAGGGIFLGCAMGGDLALVDCIDHF